MHLITNLKQLFDNFEGKAFSNGFEDYVHDIQNLNTLNKVKSNSSYKAVSDEGENPVQLLDAAYVKYMIK